MHLHASTWGGAVPVLLALFFTALAAESPGARQASDPEPHDFTRLNRKCDSCHSSVGVRSRGILRKSVGHICGECHRMNDALHHPVDMDPAMEIPADLSLDIRGVLTCATCHNVHRSRFHPLTGERTMYLRRDGPRRAFCESCHRNGIWQTLDSTVRN
ncbi:MAG: cytochrome c3 family protein [Nitrospirota bacterium]|nr:cytochrome c3 family protein [Nitrospirota bacterium]